MDTELEKKRRLVLAALMIDNINSAYDIGMTDTRIGAEEKPLWFQILAHAPDHIVQGFSDLTKLPLVVKYVKDEIARRSS